MPPESGTGQNFNLRQEVQDRPNLLDRVSPTTHDIASK